MPQYQKGVYEPGEEVRVFDGSEDDDDEEGSRLPLLIVLALLVLAMFGGVVWLAYTQGVARGRSETPVIAAAAGPARVAPANPGGTDQPYKGFKIYEQPAPPDDDSAPAKTDAKTAAPSEEPAPPPPAPKPSVAAQAPAPVSTPAPQPAKQVAAAQAKPEPAPKPAPVTPPPALPKAAAAPKPAPAPVVTEATAPPRSLATAVAPKPAPEAAPAASPSGGYVLQIGAYKSQAEADAAWKSYKAKHGALLSGYGSDVQQADLGDKGTWYRLRIAGFSSKDTASALCDRLKAEQGACFLGR